jgi:predicted ATPase
MVTPERVLVDVKGREIVQATMLPPGGEEHGPRDSGGRGDTGEVVGVRAVGAVLLEMLTGEPPQATATEADTHAPDLPSARSDVPEELALLVYRMLDEDPDLRPPSLEVVRAELQMILHALERPNGAAVGGATPTQHAASLAGHTSTGCPDDQSLHFTATPFVGRERELDELGAMLADPQCRLITLVGPGGTGKSRLAFQIAQQVSGSFRDGVHFVPLSAVRSPTFIPLAISGALDLVLTGWQDPKAQLLAHLRERQALLVLDDFDQLLEGAALVKELIESTDDLRVVVTSRERLNLRIERLFEVRGLDVPEEGSGESHLRCGAVRLFHDTATRVASDFRFETERADVVRICRLLEGMPLGLELAAGWTRVLGCKDIADEIGRDVGFLSSNQPDVPERHRGIRATFDRSWALLAEGERTVLAKLSVFSGGFQREAAAAVAGATLPHLSVFVDKSLLRRDALGRWRIHELLRQYLDERLSESPEQRTATADRHCSWCAGFVEARDLSGWAVKSQAGELEEEFGNIQKAWDWAVVNLRLNEITKMLEPLFAFCRTRGWYAAGEEVFGAAAQGVSAAIKARQLMAEAARVLGSILARQAGCRFALGDYRGCLELLGEARSVIDEEAQPKEHALALRIQSNVAVRQGRYAEAEHLLGEVRRIGLETHDRSVEGSALQELGNIALHLARYEEARRLTTEAIEIRRAMGHPRGTAVCLNTLGNIAYNSGRHSEARRYYEESLDLARNLGNRMGESALLANLGNIASILGEAEKAKELYARSLEVARQIGFHRGVSHGLYLVGGACRVLDDYDAAEGYLKESLVLHERSGDRRGAAYSLSSLGQVWHERGDHEQAQKHQQRALAIFRELHVPLGVAIAVSRLGDSVLASGEADQAQHHYGEGLKVASGIGAASTALWGVLGWARCCRAQKSPAKAAELGAFVSLHEASGNDSRTEASELLVELASELSAEKFEAAKIRGRSRTLEDIVVEITGSLEAQPSVGA